MVAGCVDDTHALVLFQGRLDTLAHDLDTYARHLGIAAIHVQNVARTRCDVFHVVRVEPVTEVDDRGILAARSRLNEVSHRRTVETFCDLQIPIFSGFFAPRIHADVRVTDG